MSDLRLAIVEGGDPGPAVTAVLAAVLARPTIVVEAQDGDQVDTPGLPSAWIRAARLEAVVPGRRITTRADLRWRR